MKNLRSLGLRALPLFLLLFLPFARVDAAQYIAQDVSQRVKAATVMVHIEYADPNQVSWGTGFVIGNGLIMTNAHVVTDRQPTRIFVHNDYLPVTEARVVAARYDANGSGIQSSYYDVALLSYTPPGGIQLPALPFAMNFSPHQSVFALGYPGADLQGMPMRTGYGSAPQAPQVLTGGIINEIIQTNPTLLMHDALCQTGNSGGPLFNSRGEVVGMQTWSADPDHRNVVSSFAISSRGLVAFVQGVGLQPYTVG